MRALFPAVFRELCIGAAQVIGFFLLLLALAHLGFWISEGALLSTPGAPGSSLARPAPIPARAALSARGAGRLFQTDSHFAFRSNP